MILVEIHELYTMMEKQVSKPMCSIQPRRLDHMLTNDSSFAEVPGQVSDCKISYLPNATKYKPSNEFEYDFVFIKGLKLMQN